MPNDSARAQHVTSGRAERAGLSYLLCCLLVLLLLYLFPLVAERQPTLKRLSLSQHGEGLDHSYGLDGDNADVVIFGDSSAMSGVDTDRLSQELGLKVTTLPATAGSLSVTGTLTLRHYLAGNRPPRLIVCYLAPWNLDFDRQPHSLSYEGVELVLRHESLRTIVDLTLRHPQEFFTFPIRFYAVPNRLNPFSDKAQFIPAPIFRGYSPHGGDDHLATGCSISYFQLHRQATQSVQTLVRDFSSAQTRTLVYLSPLPDCLLVGDVVAVHYPGIDAQPPVVLPVADFAADDSMVHVLASHSAVSTDLLSDAIRRSLSR
jgi:hypothetical protein